MNNRSQGNENDFPKNKKQEQLDQYRRVNEGKPMTTNDGKKISNDQDQLKAGIRGPTLHEDHQYFEKMTHFVKEEIPQRVVHPRGYGAHGEFECYKSMKHITKAGFLQEAGKKTPVFNRFSTVQGRSGSKDTARDMRCWGAKFYTEEGNYDLTTINNPVLINSDAMKFLMQCMRISTIYAVIFQQLPVHMILFGIMLTTQKGCIRHCGLCLIMGLSKLQDDVGLVH